MASYWRILYLTPKDNMVFFNRGYVSWTEPSARSRAQSAMLDAMNEQYGIQNFRQPRLTVLGLDGFVTYWIPDHFYGINRSGLFQVRVPLWPPTILLLIFVVWKSLLRKVWLAWRFPNSCTSCGYNLTGNVSGVCPECGTDC